MSRHRSLTRLLVTALCAAAAIGAPAAADGATGRRTQVPGSLAGAQTPAPDPADQTGEEARAASAAEPPAPLPARPLRRPELYETHLDNGLQVIVVPRHEVPLLTARLVLPGGRSAEPADETGVADFAAHLLTRGTTTRSGTELAAAIEQGGGELVATANQDSLTITVSALSDQADLGFMLLGEIALRPAFPVAELEAYRPRALVTLQAELARAGAVADRAFRAIVYGAHPYGAVTTEQSLAAITRDAVVAYYSAQADPAQAFLVVVGDVTPDDALQHARAALGDWGRTGTSPPAVPPAPPERTQRTVYLVDRPGSSQAELRVGQLASRGDAHDRYLLILANQILGGGSRARLFRHLREERGYAYGVSSRFSFPRSRGVFDVEVAVRNEVVEPALRAILDDLDDLREVPVPDAELEAVKAFLAGSYALRFQTNDSVVNEIVRLRLEGLPLGLLTEYRQRIQTQDSTTVLQAAREYLRPHEAIVVVGDAAQIRDSLDAVAPVVLVDAQGRPLE